MMNCLANLEFWIRASVHLGIVLFVLGSIALVQLSTEKKNQARLAQRKSTALTKQGPLVRSQ